MLSSPPTNSAGQDLSSSSLPIPAKLPGFQPSSHSVPRAGGPQPPPTPVPQPSPPAPVRVPPAPMRACSLGLGGPPSPGPASPCPRALRVSWRPPSYSPRWGLRVSASCSWEAGSPTGQTSLGSCITVTIATSLLPDISQTAKREPAGCLHANRRVCRVLTTLILSRRDTWQDEPGVRPPDVTAGYFLSSVRVDIEIKLDLPLAVYA